MVFFFAGIPWKVMISEKTPSERLKVERHRTAPNGRGGVHSQSNISVSGKALRA